MWAPKMEALVTTQSVPQTELPAAMSNPRPHLPPEILDHIIDLLHDNRETLLQCCLVSKSRIPRARKYLFAHVEFKSEGYDKWKKTFPDPTNSLAHHVYTLTVDGSLRGAEDSSWIRGFARVERLIVDGEWAGSNVTSISFVPFHRLAASIKALDITFTLLLRTQIFDLICSPPPSSRLSVERRRYYRRQGRIGRTPSCRSFNSTCVDRDPRSFSVRQHRKNTASITVFTQRSPLSKTRHVAVSCRRSTSGGKDCGGVS